MKEELSIEQKAKAYDKIVNRLKSFMMQGVDPLITRADVQDFFPELAISEDERIRKALINIFATHKDYEVYFGVSVEDIRVWLEQKLATWKPTEEEMKVLDEVLTYAANHESHYWNDYIFGTLCDLIRQLKKLKA